MELVQVVNSDGTFTGKVVDKEYAHDYNLLHAEVAIFLVNDKGQTLLQLRSANKRFNPNKWGLSGGHVRVGESFEQAILREVEEELGITLRIEDLSKFENAWSDIVMAEKNSHITYFYYAKCNYKESDFRIQEDELSKVKWFDIDEVINMINDKDPAIVFTKNRAKYFEMLQDILQHD